MNKRAHIVFLFLLFFIGGCGSNKSDKELSKLKAPLGLEKLNENIPEDNQLTKGKIALGRNLFFDKRLSVDGTVSCDFCHNPLLGFSDGRYFASGVFGLKSKRNTGTLVNRVYGQEYFGDGSAKSIEDVILNHLEDVDIYGNKIENVVKVLSADKKYADQFNRVFDTDVNAEGISKAIAAFVRTLVSGDSPYDKYVAGNKYALSESEIRGMKLFMSSRLNCTACHSGPNFTDEQYHNNGTKIDSLNPDFGRYLVTKKEEDKFKFRTPTLRDISRTSPYMHNGSLKGLNNLIKFYDEGGISNKYQSPLIKPLHLTEEEKVDLKNFLRSLTGTNTYFFGN